MKRRNRTEKQSGWDRSYYGMVFTGVKILLALVSAGAGILTQNVPWLAIAGLMLRLLMRIRDGHSPFLPGTDGCIRAAGWVLLGKGIFGTLLWQESDETL